MRSTARGACGPREHDAQHVCVLVLADQVAKREELRRGARRVPAAKVRLARHAHAPELERVQPGARVTQLGTERVEVVARRLDADQKTVERRELDAGRVAPRLERLHERRPRACERIKHAPAGREVAVEQHFDELRDELAVVRVQPVNVLRAHVLRQRALRPRELEVQGRIELVLRDGHEERTSLLRQPALLVTALAERERLVRDLRV